jgi:hypothetical protein
MIATRMIRESRLPALLWDTDRFAHAVEVWDGTRRISSGRLSRGLGKVIG